MLVLSYPVDPTDAAQMTEMAKVARSLGVVLQKREIRSPNDFAAAFDAGVEARADALLSTSPSIFFTHRAQVLEGVARNRWPAIFQWRAYAEAGGLLSYAHRLDDLSRRTAYYVDRILKGAKPGDLPVEQPTTFETIVNLKTARALGIALPPSTLLRADEVIE